MSNETYVYYDVYNHTNQPGTDSFALPFCQFKFIPKIDGLEDAGVLSNTKVLWDFGDGSTSQSLTGIHSYKEPGDYRVQSFFFDEEGEAYANTYVRTVVVKNFVEDNVKVFASDASEAMGMVLSAGRINTPITIIRCNSYQRYQDDQVLSIVPFASGGGISESFYDGVSSLLYSHLEKYHAFYTREINRAGVAELVEIPRINTTSNKLYCKLANNTVQMTLASDPNAFFCGTSGSEIIYFKDDLASDPINLLFGFDTTIFGVNTSTVGLSCSVVKNTDYQFISITSNGVDGEGTRLTSFDFTSNKFIGVKIPFIVKVKDTDWYTIKDVEITGVIGNIVDENTGFPMTATIVFEDYSQGYVKGYVIGQESSDRVHLTFQLTMTDGNTVTIKSGVSETFALLDPADTYQITKQGEYFDMTASYKELGFQDLFNDKDVLFNDFLGSIVGNLSSGPNTLGKKIHEKIANFVDNNSNIEKCNVAQLVSLLDSIGDENILFEKSNFNFPAALKRLIDILSIKHSKLFGAPNNFDLDFVNHGNSQEYQGKNLGRKLDTLTYVVSGGTPIVALEKYSSTFKKIDTYRSLSATSIQQQLSTHPGKLEYTLSSYNPDWGWGLVLNDNYVATDLPKYYNFFEYIPNAQANYKNNVINFSDFNNTIPATLSSYSAWTDYNGIIETIIANQLYNGLDLL